MDLCAPLDAVIVGSILARDSLQPVIENTRKREQGGRHEDEPIALVQVS